MIPILNFWRLIFILMIFLFHFGVFPYGYFPVTFFFILSGFVLTYGYGKEVVKESFVYSAFMKKRLIKIYPLHLLCLVYVLITTFAEQQTLPNYIIPNLLLVQSWIPLRPAFFSCNGVTWFLADILVFYSFFPFVQRLINKHYTACKYGLFALLILYVACIPIVPKDLYQAIYYVNPLVRMLDFIMGMFLCRWFLQVENKQLNVGNPKLLLMVSVILLTVAIFIHSEIVNSYKVYTYGVLYWLPCCMLIFYSAIVKNMPLKFLCKLGTYSFSFYMIHQLFIIDVNEFLTSVDFPENVYLRLFITLPICYLLGCAINIYFEKPIISFLLKKFSLRKSN